MRDAIPSHLNESDLVNEAAAMHANLTPERIFYLASQLARFGSQSEDKARELYDRWETGGYDCLPDWAKDYVLQLLGCRDRRGGRAA